MANPSVMTDMRQSRCTMRKESGGRLFSVPIVRGSVEKVMQRRRLQGVIRGPGPDIGNVGQPITIGIVAEMAAEPAYQP